VDFKFRQRRQKNNAFHLTRTFAVSSMLFEKGADFYKKGLTNKDISISLNYNCACAGN
jgi:hypothetical protein